MDLGGRTSSHYFTKVAESVTTIPWFVTHSQKSIVLTSHEEISLCHRQKQLRRTTTNQKAEKPSLLFKGVSMFQFTIFSKVPMHSLMSSDTLNELLCLHFQFYRFSALHVSLLLTLCWLLARCFSYNLLWLSFVFQKAYDLVVTWKTVEILCNMTIKCPCFLLSVFSHIHLSWCYNT